LVNKGKIVPDPLFIKKMSSPYQDPKPKYRDGRRDNGGARRGAGRPVSDPWRLNFDKYLSQKVLVPERRHGQIRYVKKTILTATLDKLRDQGVKGDLRAIKLYLDITLGKPANQKGGKQRYRKHSAVKALALTGMVR
jgi:hypothetical protein